MKRSLKVAGLVTLVLLLAAWNSGITPPQILFKLAGVVQQNVTQVNFDSTFTGVKSGNTLTVTGASSGVSSVAGTAGQVTCSGSSSVTCGLATTGSSGTYCGAGQAVASETRDAYGRVTSSSCATLGTAAATGQTGQAYRDTKMLSTGHVSYSGTGAYALGAVALNPADYSVNNMTRSIAVRAVAYVSSGSLTGHVRLYNLTRSEYTTCDLTFTTTTPTLVSCTATIGGSSGNLRDSETDIYEARIWLASVGSSSDTIELSSIELYCSNTF